MSKGAVWGIVVGVSVAVLVGVGSCVGFFVWAKHSGEELQEGFYRAVLSEEPNRLMALFDPALREEVDEPVLQQWMAAVNANLGGFKGLSSADFHTSTNITAAGKVTESKGTVEFEKGQASSELTFKDGKLIAFHVKSDKLATDWAKPLTGDQTKPYQDRGRQFLTYFLTDKPDEAFAMMHESLQKAAPKEKLKAMMADPSVQGGVLKTIEFQGAGPDDTGKLKIDYRIEMAEATKTASVKFGLDGLKYHLVGFNIKPKE